MMNLESPFYKWIVDYWGICIYVICAIGLIFTEQAEILFRWFWHAVGDPSWTWIIVHRKRDIWRILLYGPATLLTLTIWVLLAVSLPTFTVCRSLVLAARKFREFYQALPD